MRVLKSYKICFLGKTGYGKSSLINCLFRTNFSTDPFYSCTKELYSVTTLKDAPQGFDAITVYDTPGIGEFADNEPYQKYYDYAFSNADVIVLVSTFSRTDAPEQELLMDLKKIITTSKEMKFVIALNYIDSSKVALSTDYEAWNHDKNIPSEECALLINERIQILHEKFDSIFMPSSIVPVCAMRNYGIQELKKTILTVK